VTDPKALFTEPNLVDPDAAYRLIAQAHRDLSEAESAAFNARLVLILANHLGDVEILRQALALAREAR
jgi:predicted LPLAT superfamily acyltransferase